MATIRDVARESGVSVATVSYVLNNGPRPVRAQTRERVLAVMRHLNYHPNALARGLLRRRMNTVAVLFGKIEWAVVTNPYATTVLEGILSAAAELDYNVTLMPKPWVDIRHSAGPFRDRRTDGVVIVAPLEESDLVSGLAALGLPLVVVSAQMERYGVPCFDVDNEAGGRLATEHLLTLGHTRIAHIGGSASFGSAAPRRAGYLNALQDAGIAPFSPYIVEGDYGGGGMGELVDVLMALPEPAPPPFSAGNDRIALAFLEAAFNRGISVPDQFSVVGFDDVPLASQLTPPMTTVRQPLTDFGAEAVHRLVRRIEGGPAADPAPLLRLAAPELIVRRTTAPPRWAPHG